MRGGAARQRPRQRPRRTRPPARRPLGVPLLFPVAASWDRRRPVPWLPWRCGLFRAALSRRASPNVARRGAEEGRGGESLASAGPPSANVGATPQCPGGPARPSRTRWPDDAPRPAGRTVGVSCWPLGALRCVGRRKAVEMLGDSAVRLPPRLGSGWRTPGFSHAPFPRALLALAPYGMDHRWGG